MIEECNHDPMFKLCDTCILLNQREQLAKAVLVAHSQECMYCPYTMDAVACADLSHDCEVLGFGCYCDACKLARQVLPKQPEADNVS